MADSANHFDCNEFDVDTLYEACVAAIDHADWEAALDCADKIRQWCGSDCAKQYESRSVTVLRGYADLVNLTHAHKVKR